MNGKQKCALIQSIRRQIALENNIEFLSFTCNQEGPCNGSCPKSEAEHEWLNYALNKNVEKGKSIILPDFDIQIDNSIEERIHSLEYCIELLNTLKSQGVVDMGNYALMTIDEIFSIVETMGENRSSLIQRFEKMGYIVTEEDLDRVVEILEKSSYILKE